MAMRLALAAAFALALACALVSRPARASDCLASDAKPTAPRRVATLREAQKLAYAKRYPDARALYLWVLAREPADETARTGLARVDAWDGCWSMAEREFRQVLYADPTNDDARAGLVDLYMWQNEWSLARGQIDAGLALDPKSETLLIERARLAHFSFDDTEAIAIVEALDQRKVKDEELEELRDELFHGEASLAFRADVYPSDYPNIYTMDAELLQRWHKFDFTLGAHLVDWVGGGLTDAIVDSERTLRIGYHPDPGVTVAIEGGFGNPGVVLPQGEFAAELGFPIYRKLTGVLDYDYWQYSTSESVHILSPTLAYEWNDQWDFAVHAWIVHVGVGDTGVGEWAETWGANASWKPVPRLTLMVYYTYGVELDRDPTFVQLFQLRGHVVTLSADWLVTHDWGVRALIAGERREQDGVPTIYIGSLGGGAYVRW